MRGAKLTAAGLVAAVSGTLGLVLYESLANSWIAESLSSSTTAVTAHAREGAGGGDDDDDDDDDDDAEPSSPAAAAAATAWFRSSDELCPPNGTARAGRDVTASSSSSSISGPADETIEWMPCVDRPWVRTGFNDDSDNDGLGAKDDATLPHHHWLGWGNRNVPGRNHRRGAPNQFRRRRRRRPPYKVLLTNFGWNHPDPSVRLNVTRSIRSREFVTGIVNHPLFDPTHWDEIQARATHGTLDGRGDDASDTASRTTRYYVFLDVETCYESNYPVYGGGPDKNLDSVGGRVDRKDRIRFDCYAAIQCPSIRRVLDSPLFRLYPNRTKLVFFDCRGNSMPPTMRHKLISNQFAVASYSAGTDQHDLAVDQGLAAPAVTKIDLTRDEVRDIENCDAETNRTLLFTFVGSVRNQVRTDMITLHNPSQGIISLPLMKYRDEYATGVTNITFTDMLRGSVFAGTPIGDNRFSYRFTEVLAAGAIPVVHSDGWVLPFRRELVDWTECLLHLPEASVRTTISILRNITVERRCQMRKKCRDIYTRYMADGQGTIRGILDGLELVATTAAATEASASPMTAN